MEIIVATKINGLADAIARKGYNVVTEVDSTDGLQRIFGSSESLANTLLVTEKINSNGSLVSVLLDIHQHYPEVRIIFLATGDLENRFTVNQLHMLASKGIYDLYYEGKITIDKIVDLIENPKMQFDCKDVFDAYNNLSDNAPVAVQQQTVRKGVDEDLAKNNVIGVTSVKPGTGKSFVSSNLAVTLAKYGKTLQGNPAKILLLEGDLQTLSITTLFGIKDDNFNLKTALRKIDEFFEKNNYNTDRWYDGARNEKDFISRCCLPTDVENLYVLEGHNFDFNDVSECDPASYYYLVDYLSSIFDVVIIDSNSSLQHPTTDPIFQLSKSLYFVYTTDFNNLKLNIKYQSELAKLGVADKIRYILNKTLVGEQRENYHFEYTDEEIIGNKLRIDFKVPNVDMGIIYNSTYEHNQVTKNENNETLAIRIAFLRIANDILPLGRLDDIEAQVGKIKKDFGGSLSKKDKKGGLFKKGK